MQVVDSGAVGVWRREVGPGFGAYIQESLVLKPTYQCANPWPLLSRLCTFRDHHRLCVGLVHAVIVSIKRASDQGGEGRHIFLALSLSLSLLSVLSTSAFISRAVGTTSRRTTPFLSAVSIPRCVNGSVTIAVLLPHSAPAAHPTPAFVQFARGLLSLSQSPPASVATTPSSPAYSRIRDIHP